MLLLCSALICLVGFVMATIRPAYGYADPGSGLLAVQMLGAAVSAIGFYLRHKIHRIFGRWKNPANAAEGRSASATEVGGVAVELPESNGRR